MSLRYCLSDRAKLVPVEEETVIRGGQLRVNIQQTTDNAIPDTAFGENKAPRSSKLWAWLIGLVIVGFIGLIAIGAIGGVAYYALNQQPDDQGNKKATPTATPQLSPTTDPEKKRLEEQLANVQRQLDEQKNANRTLPINTQPPLAPTPPPADPGVVRARVNSPGDGFLALRSQPSSEYGERIVQIPHGEIVTIENCERREVKVGNRTGRWCVVSWNSYEGWAFSAWLDWLN